MAAPPTVIRSKAAAFLKAVKVQLAQFPAPSGAMIEDRIFIIAPEETADYPPFTQGDNDLVVKLHGIRPEQEVIAAAGRIDSRFHRILSVTVRSRLGVDETTRDYTWLTDAQLGHFALEEAVIDSLHIGWTPTDDAGNVLVVQPVRLVSVSDTVKSQQTNDWGMSRLDFDIYFQQALDQTQQ
jgi:hypothetical protein